MFKQKNDDEKPKRRPRGWMIFVAIGLMVIGIIGALQGLSRSAAPVPTPTPVMVFQNVTVQSYSMETTYTIQTSSGTTTTTLQDDDVLAEIMPAVIETVNTALETTTTMTTSSPYPANRLIYNVGSDRMALDLRTGEKTMLGMYDEGRDVLSPNGAWWARWVVDGELGDSWLEVKSVQTGEKHFPFQQRFYGTGVRVNWSPDSQWIVFHAAQQLSSPDTEVDVWRVNVETGALERLTDNGAFDTDPDLSSDGTQLVYTSDAEAPSELHILTLATGKTRRLVDRVGYASRWSPDGQWIVFNTMLHASGELWIVRADGTDAQMVVPEASYWSFGWER